MTAARGEACRNGHAFVTHAVGDREEWYCVVCFFVPSARELLAAYVEKHGGKIL